jgi:hypothetical protein
MSGKEMMSDECRVRNPTSAITYPARPVQGGRLDLAPPKFGEWCYSPKYNGWRVLIHVPTLTCFNRKGERLSIADEFKEALGQLRHVLTWLDCEALERRHQIGQGSLVILDWVSAYTPHLARMNLLEHYWSVAPLDPLKFEADSVYLAPHWFAPSAPELWQELQSLNAAAGNVPFYEGVVAKRADSTYPIQLDSPDKEFTGWVKHRFDQ